MGKRTAPQHFLQSFQTRKRSLAGQATRESSGDHMVATKTLSMVAQCVSPMGNVCSSTTLRAHVMPTIPRSHGLEIIANVESTMHAFVWAAMIKMRRMDMVMAMVIVTAMTKMVLHGHKESLKENATDVTPRGV